VAFDAAKRVGIVVGLRLRKARMLLVQHQNRGNLLDLERTDPSDCVIVVCQLGAVYDCRKVYWSWRSGLSAGWMDVVR
jgi:hypothetical protein